MAQSPIVQAIKHICEEKNIPLEMVVETVESALAAAYRKDFGQLNQNIKVELNMETGEFDVFDVKNVVEDVELDEDGYPIIEGQERVKKEESEDEKSDEKTKKDEGDQESEEDDEIKKFNNKLDLMITEAVKVDPKAKLGDTLKTQLVVPEAFGRMAAQTAKQVVIQKLREAERHTIFEEFKQKEGDLITGTIQRREARKILVDLGRAIGVVLQDGMVSVDKYNSGDRMKFYVEKVEMGSKGPDIILSRSHFGLVQKLFAFEIPEISSGVIEIIGVAREAGSRSKIAVKPLEDNIDPIGSCVGQRGTRVQTIISELGGEKIDIIEYSDDPVVYITNALSPAKVQTVTVDEDKKSATINVSEDQLSLAIGKSGQNVRLAARLTGWKLNINGKSDDELSGEEKTDESSESKSVKEKDEETKPVETKEETSDLEEEKVSDDSENKEEVEDKK